MAKQTFTSGQVLTAAQMNSLQANDYNWTVDTKTDNYTLVAGDAGKRIVMNAATAKTITVNTSVFTAGDVVWIHNINTGTCTITAGTATVNTAGSLALGQWGGGALYFTSASTAIFFPAGTGYGVASGGTSSSITVGGVNYTLLTFTATGTLTVATTGYFDIMFWGAGGGGGANTGAATRAGGGGGASAYVLSSLYLAAGTYTITIGAGGAVGSRGGSSSIGTNNDRVIALGGSSSGGTGGCGGGAWSTGVNSLGGTIGTAFDTFTGYNGGQGHEIAGGGGGGQAAIGGNAARYDGGAGAAGIDISTFIGGSTLYKGAGGGGAGYTVLGTGGSSIGGNGARGAGGGALAATAGAANSASGGGGAIDSNAGGAGGSGICYVRFK